MIATPKSENQTTPTEPPEQLGKQHSFRVHAFLGKKRLSAHTHTDTNTTFRFGAIHGICIGLDRVGAFCAYCNAVRNVRSALRFEAVYWVLRGLGMPVTPSDSDPPVGAPRYGMTSSAKENDESLKLTTHIMVLSTRTQTMGCINEGQMWKCVENCSQVVFPTLWHWRRLLQPPHKVKHTTKC
eukprot:585976-Amphidinium_carterae.1